MQLLRENDQETKDAQWADLQLVSSSGECTLAHMYILHTHINIPGNRTLFQQTGLKGECSVAWARLGYSPPAFVGVVLKFVDFNKCLQMRFN